MNEIVKQINSYKKEFDFCLTKEHPFDNGSESSADEVDNANDVERVTLEVFLSKILQLTREAVCSEQNLNNIKEAVRDASPPVPSTDVHVVWPITGHVRHFVRQFGFYSFPFSHS